MIPGYTTIELEEDEVEYIVAFIKSHEWDSIPHTLRDDILPKLEEFIEDYYT